MEVQNKNNIRVILYVLVLIAVFSIIFLIFKIEISNEKLEKNKVGLVDENTILPTPDRIIYKNIILNTRSEEHRLNSSHNVISRMPSSA